MSWIDYLTIVATLCGILFLGFLFSKRAGSSSDEFILAGRKLPWWLAGTSVSAAAFNSDSPLHNARRARLTGLGGLWLYWSYIVGQVMCSVFFVRYARRSGIKTPVELMEVRYGGKAGKAARIWQAVYSSLFQSGLSLSVGLLAMLKLTRVLIDLPDKIEGIPSDVFIVLIIIGFAVAYSAAAGLWGVVATDFIEFFIALFCSFILTFIVLAKVGWGSGLADGLQSLSMKTGIDYINAAPRPTLAFFVWFLLAPVVLAGVSSTNMRYLAARDERDAVLAGIWQQFVSFAVRGWPWWIAGFASLLLLGEVSDAEMAYPMLIREYMPVGLKGLMIAGFICAFLSTVDTKLHEFAAIVVNDLYRPYLAKGRADKHYIRVMRFSVLIAAVFGSVMALAFDDILEVLLFGFKVNAMIGIAMVLKWYWWRMNGWADLTMQVLALPVALLLHFDAKIFPALGFGSTPTQFFMERLGGYAGITAGDGQWAVQYILGVLIVTLVGVVLSFLLPKDDPQYLAEFYKTVRPYGAWKPIQKIAGCGPTDCFGRDAVNFGLGVLFSYAGLFGFGALFFAKWIWAAVLFILCIAAFRFLIVRLNREYQSGPKMEAESCSGI